MQTDTAAPAADLAARRTKYAQDLQRAALTLQRLREVLHYDPSTGVFVRRLGPRAGAPAGAHDSQGHRQIRVDGRLYLAHRLAWLYMTGAWTESDTDHKNGIRDDNRWDNLRACTNQQNAQNQVRRVNNRSGYLGVSWHATDRKWVAQIQTRGEKVTLGRFDDPLVAHQAYLAAKAEKHTFQPVPRDVADRVAA